MKLGESLEDYLETLLLLEQTGRIRCVDVASKMHVSKPSVNKAMNVLKEKGYVLQESYGDIHLTEAGREFAMKVYERHRVIYAFLTEVLGVSVENANEDACHIEHILSEETFTKLTMLVEKHQNNQ